LGEVEAALSGESGVAQVAVTARGEAPEDKQLVAYLVPAAGARLEPAALRRSLKERLPDYLVPSAFVVLEALPLMSNGKLDIQSLPLPDRSNGASGGSFAAPRDALEAELAKIWEEVLDVRPIGVTDNFFELGGHSLLAVRLFAKIERIFEKSLPLVSLFHGPTVEQLAEVVRSKRSKLSEVTPDEQCAQNGSSAFDSSLMTIQSCGSKRPLFLVPSGIGGEAGLVTLAKLVSPWGKERPVYALKPRGLDGRQKCHPSVNAMAADYIRAIRTIQPQGPYFLAGECQGGVVAFEMARQMDAQGQRIGALVLLDTLAPVRRQRLLYRFDEVSRVLRITRVMYHLNQLRQLRAAETMDCLLKCRRRARMLVDRASGFVRRRSSPTPETMLKDVADELASYRLKKRMNEYVQVIRTYVPEVFAHRIYLLLSETHRREKGDLWWKS
ncbi:MAG TPA: thioesterase domain-containing protein, partial [Terrimicrobiaceae bacterium]